MDYAKESLRLHNEWKGKIEVIATVPVASKEDLSLAWPNPVWKYRDFRKKAIPLPAGIICALS